MTFRTAPARRIMPASGRPLDITLMADQPHARPHRRENRFPFAGACDKALLLQGKSRA
jgi:hypothetical protein